MRVSGSPVGKPLAECPLFTRTCSSDLLVPEGPLSTQNRRRLATGNPGPTAGIDAKQKFTTQTSTAGP